MVFFTNVITLVMSGGDKFPIGSIILKVHKIIFLRKTKPLKNFQNYIKGSVVRFNNCLRFHFVSSSEHGIIR